MLLSIENVSKFYRSHCALDNVSLNVPAGSIFGLLGPNGAGKTSLIRIINQITAPDEGLVLFNSIRLNDSHTSMIGYLPEERGLYKKMETWEQAMYMARLRGLDKHHAKISLKKWFDKFELMPWWNKKVEELSKGMQQKLQFIIAVLHDPKLLILDEPFTGFDPINANIIRDELLNMQKNGCTIILSTHRMESVEEMCSHIALINKSKKILDGPVGEIKNSHKSNLYQIDYKGSKISFTHSLWTNFELITTDQTGDLNRATVKLLGNKTPNDLLRAVMSECQVYSLHEIIPSMNDIFISQVSNTPIIKGEA
jgi:ABC-2 type transport system ATP-binding protein